MGSGMTTALSADCFAPSGMPTLFGAKVLPLPPVEHVAHGRYGHSIFRCEVLDLFSTSTPSFRFKRAFGRHLCFPVPFSYADTLTTLGDLVSHVVGLRAKKQVGRVYTRRDVTFMADVKAFGCSVSRFIGKAMGQNSSISASSLENSVPLRVFGARPQNASVGLRATKSLEPNFWEGHDSHSPSVSTYHLVSNGR